MLNHVTFRNLSCNCYKLPGSVKFLTRFEREDIFQIRYSIKTAYGWSVMLALITIEDRTC